MPTPTHDSTWDFSPVFDLIHSLSHKHVESGQGVETPTARSQATDRIDHQELKNGIEEGLGDFNKVWDYLGVQRDVPQSSVPAFEAVTTRPFTDRDAYASDGALYYPQSSKSVKWRDEEEGLDLTDVQPESPPAHGELTRSQRKKKNRKARKAAEWAAQAERLEQKRFLRETRGSGDDSEGSPPGPVPVRLAGSYSLAPLQLGKKEIESHLHKDRRTDTRSAGVIKDISVDPDVVDAESVNTKVTAGNTHDTVEQHKATPVRPKINGTLRPASVTPTAGPASLVRSIQSHTPSKSGFSQPTPASPKTPIRPPVNVIQSSLENQWPTENPFVNRMISASAQAARAQPLVSTPVRNNTVTQTPSRNRYELLPLTHNNSVERNWSLLLKLIHNFPADRAHILSPLQLTINRPVANGIHVFVDASNIIIGFHDTLKRARNIPQYAHVPHVNLNFHALALLLERRRPVTKRVLAGSSPEIPAFEEARQVGYETNILDKVYKAKELTEKQRRYAINNAARRNAYQAGSDGAGDGLSASNGFTSDGAAVDTVGSTLPPQRLKWVEQAVDEILHLKILESIIDTTISTAVPGVNNAQAQQATSTSPPPVAPTMVLATGDAAEAEYSPGFMKMVHRALASGWNVEVMAWSKSVSMDYRRMEKSSALGERFKIIELDDYAEELFGEAV